MSGKLKNKTRKQAELNTDALALIKAQLNSFACTEAWTESILSTLLKRDSRGKLLVRYQVDSQGRLKTKMHDLLEMIAEAKLYPPLADDAGSQMRPCFCEQCTRPNRRGKARHVHWPAHYMVADRISHTCAVNRASVDEREVEDYSREVEIDFDGRIERGRAFFPSEAQYEIRMDPDAWRGDKLRRLPWMATFRPWYCQSADIIGADEADRQEALLQEIISSFIIALKAHRWRKVVGECDGKKNNNAVRLVTMGLSNLGSLSDFVQLHSLTEVRGINAEVAAAIAAMVNDYPRDPRPRQIYFKQQKTHIGKRR